MSDHEVAVRLKEHLATQDARPRSTYGRVVLLAIAAGILMTSGQFGFHYVQPILVESIQTAFPSRSGN